MREIDSAGRLKIRSCLPPPFKSFYWVLFILTLVCFQSYIKFGKQIQITITFTKLLSRKEMCLVSPKLIMRSPLLRGPLICDYHLMTLMSGWNYAARYLYR